MQGVESLPCEFMELTIRNRALPVRVAEGQRVCVVGFKRLIQTIFKFLLCQFSHPLSTAHILPRVAEGDKKSTGERDYLFPYTIIISH